MRMSRKTGVLSILVSTLMLKANQLLTFFAGITRTKLRYHRCQARAVMPENVRRKDAQADQNLDDVNRFPPPWDLQPLAPNSPTSR